MQMKRSTQRPGLRQRPSFPQRVPDVRLGDPIDAHSELELRGSLYLRMHPAELVSDLDEPIGVDAVHQ
jgi:hypothetical protein